MVNYFPSSGGKREVKKSPRRNPKGYNGTEVTSHQIRDLLPQVISNVMRAHQDRPHLIMASWPEIVGPRIATLTRAVSYRNGVLHVRVKNSTVYSVLSQSEKPHLLDLLRKKFPKVTNIHFRLG